MVGTDSSGGQSGSSLNLVTSLPSSLYMSSFDTSCYSASILNNIVERNSIDGLAWIQIVPEDGYGWAEGAWFFLFHIFIPTIFSTYLVHHPQYQHQYHHNHHRHDEGDGGVGLV